MIEVGAAVEPLGITSPVPMSGFAARTEPSAGEHDVLGARALAMDETVLITLDVCALEESTCRAIAEALRPEMPDQVIVTATHTHAGPCSTPTRLARCTSEIELQLIHAATAAGRAALEARTPCDVEFRVAHGVGVAKNRRHSDRLVDPPVQLLRFTAVQDGEAKKARDIAALVTYPCHPVVLDGTNQLLSGDYVHPLRQRLEAEHPGSVAVFATGCAGDLNTGHSAEASYSLQSTSTRTFAEAERIGTRIAEAALAGEPQTVTADRVSSASAPVTLRFDRPDAEKVAADSASWARALATADPGEAALLEVWLEWVRDRPEGTAWNGRVSAFRLGEITVVALPGEPFLEAAEQISAQTAGPCLVLGYADGCPGYFPMAGEYPYGGYEVDDAHRYYGMPGPFAAGSAETLIQRAVETCRALG